jgi:hypothetical protein
MQFLKINRFAWILAIAISFWYSEYANALDVTITEFSPGNWFVATEFPWKYLMPTGWRTTNYPPWSPFEAIQLQACSGLAVWSYWLDEASLWFWNWFNLNYRNDSACLQSSWNGSIESFDSNGRYKVINWWEKLFCPYIDSTNLFFWV